MKNQAKTFQVSRAANAAKEFGLCLVGSSAIERLRPHKCGTPTRSRDERNATGWSSGFSRSQCDAGKGNRINSGLQQGLHATDSFSDS
jgi:hypothetical protein